MEISEAKKREYGRRLMLSRMRLLCKSGFYGLLLMHLKMNLATEHETAWSDGSERLYFHPDFLDGISEEELDYVLSHLLLHIVLDHTGRRGKYREEEFHLAADILVNSNILRAHGGGEESISLSRYGGVQPHLAPSGEEGWKYTVEELCKMLRGKSEKGKSEKGQAGDGQAGGRERDKGNRGRGKAGDCGWDYHADPGEEPAGRQDSMGTALAEQLWQGRILQAAEAIRLRDPQKSRGLLPAFVERYVEELKKPQTDWRTVLDEFVQEEINDYSFCPPDRRFSETPFFLPDYNEKDDRVEKILFMIDASGSMSDQQVTQCYSEIKGAIDQFQGKLEGWLGFFDAWVTEPVPFSDEEEFLAIRPKGGGGTRFDIIFSYVRDHMQGDPPVSIVILTDGYASFPEIGETMEIPVLWIINNESVTPPWGKVARILSEAE